MAEKAKEKKYFHVLETEDEFDRYMSVTASTIGVALLRKKKWTKKEVDSFCDTAVNNVLFLCQEYAALMKEGVIEEPRVTKDVTREQARKHTIGQLEDLEKFFGITKGDTDGSEETGNSSSAE